MGSYHYPLSEQIADTRSVHGDLWTRWHYMFNPKGPKLNGFEWAILGGF